jgi:hypothetical protein
MIFEFCMATTSAGDDETSNILNIANANADKPVRIKLSGKVEGVTVSGSERLRTATPSGIRVSAAQTGPPPDGEGSFSGGAGPARDDRGAGPARDRHRRTPGLEAPSSDVFRG